MTIEENTAFYLQQHGDPSTGQHFSPQIIRQKVQEALFMVGLEGVEKKCPLIYQEECVNERDWLG
ncbi:MAG: hypothetical protein K2X08_01965 [Chlamydiales bacterium]|nr:hypothetical protein [Chlamydiales bacterium]